MNTPHPLKGLEDGGPLLATFAALLILAAFTAYQAWGMNLKTDAAPRRAISLELAFTEQRANDVIESWKDKGVTDEVYYHLIWDNLFIVFYSTLAALGCVMAARAFFGGRPKAYGLALAVAWLPWLAGMFEYVENSAMYAMMDGFKGETLPRLGGRCAAAKFAIIIPVALYALAGSVAYVLKWRRGTLKTPHASPED